MTIVDRYEVETRFATIRAVEARAALAELKHREQILEEAVRLAEQAEEAACRAEQSSRAGKS